MSGSDRTFNLRSNWNVMGAPEIEIAPMWADAVYGRIVLARRNNEYPFNLLTTVTPQDEAHLPEGIRHDLEVYAYFLFCLCYFMTGMDSITAARGMFNLYRDMPQIFEHPESILGYTAAELSALLSCYGLSQNEDGAKSWLLNVETLIGQWGGSVLKLVEGLDESYDEACRRILSVRRGDRQISGFRGFQHKMVSMLLYFLMAEGLMPEFYHPIPVDFHILRLTFANGVARPVDHNPENNYYHDSILAQIRQVTEDFERRNEVGPIELCNALWLYGKAMCRYNPGNRTIQVGPYKATRTILVAHEPKWDRTELKSWERGCGSCVVQSTCDWDIPAARYYRGGKLILLRPRSKPTAGSQDLLLNPYTIAPEGTDLRRTKPHNDEPPPDGAPPITIDQATLFDLP